MTSTIDTTIFVFAKPPRAGTAKTRLGARLGDDVAASLAAAFFADVWSVACNVPRARVVLAGTDPALSAYGLPDETRFISQGDGDLGERMARVLAAGLAETRFAILVGTDCPGIDAPCFESARATLDAYDACLAPTRDGGFYLVALRRIERDLFEGIPWSTRDAYDATRARFESRGLLVGRGAPWFDVDDVEDLDEVRSAWAVIRENAPATADTMTRLGLAPDAREDGVEARPSPTHPAAGSDVGEVCGTLPSA